MRTRLLVLEVIISRCGDRICGVKLSLRQGRRNTPQAWGVGQSATFSGLILSINYGIFPKSMGEKFNAELLVDRVTAPPSTVQTIIIYSVDAGSSWNLKILPPSAQIGENLQRQITQLRLWCFLFLGSHVIVEKLRHSETSARKN